MLKFMGFTRNDLANKLRILRRLHISLTAPNLSFRCRRELSTGLHLQQKAQDTTT